MKRSVKDRIFRTVTILVVVAVILLAIYIMVNRLGLIDGYDFGVGAYYYVDIPDFEKVLPDNAFQTELPVWVHILSFFAWGWLMWRAWLWIDRK